MVSAVSPILTVSAPPTVHKTMRNVVADRTALSHQKRRGRAFLSRNRVRPVASQGSRLVEYHRQANLHVLRVEVRYPRPKFTFG